MKLVFTILLFVLLCNPAKGSNVAESLPEMVKRADLIAIVKVTKVAREIVMSVDGRRSIQLSIIEGEPLHVLKGRPLEKDRIKISFYDQAYDNSRQGNIISVRENGEYLFFLQLRSERLLPMLPSSAFDTQAELSFFTREPIEEKSFPKPFEKRELMDSIRKIYQRQLKEESSQ